MDNKPQKLQSQQMTAEETAQTIHTCLQGLASKNNNKQSEMERRKLRQKQAWQNQAIQKQIASIESTL